MSVTVPTISELIDIMVDELGEDSNDTEITTRIERWINDVFEDVLSRRYDWKWARGMRELTLSAPYQTGTVTVTEGSKIVTGDTTVWLTAWANRIFWVTGGGANYRVASVDSNTQLTLETEWQEATQAGASYILVQDRYPLNNEDYEAGIIEIVNPYDNEPLDEIDMEDLISDDPKLRTLGDPDAYAVWGHEGESATTNPGGVFIYFNSYPSSNRKFHYFHHRQFARFTGTDRLPLPKKFYRNLIKYGVLAVARHFDDQIPEAVSQKYETLIQLMIQENSISGDRIRRLKETDVPHEEGGSSYPSWYPRIRV